MTEGTPASSVDVLFPGKDVKLASGEYLHVKPWGISMSRRMLSRIKTVIRMLTVARGGDMGLEQLIEESYDEVLGILADSLGLTSEQLLDDDRFLLEDFFALLDAVITVNFVERPQMGEKLLGLLGKLEVLVPAPKAATEEAAATEAPETPSEGPSSS